MNITVISVTDLIIKIVEHTEEKQRVKSLKIWNKNKTIFIPLIRYQEWSLMMMMMIIMIMMMRLMM